MALGAGTRGVPAASAAHKRFVGSKTLWKAGFAWPSKIKARGSDKPNAGGIWGEQ